MARGEAVTDPGLPRASAIPSTSGLEAVYLANRQALVRFLRVRGAGDRAEDLVQELWLRIVSTPSGPVFDPLNYLFRAANNLMLNRVRSEKRDDARHEAWTDAHMSSPESGADAALVARQEIAKARQRLIETGSRVQDVFFLFRVEGMSQRDIAARFGVSLSAVEKDIQRAYRAIAALKDEADA